MFEIVFAATPPTVTPLQSAGSVVMRARVFVTAVQAQVLIAREQRGVGQRRRGIERLRPRMALGGDDGMQVEHALRTSRAADPAVHGDAGIAEGPGDGAARVEARGILPAHPVEHATVGVERKQAYRMDARDMQVDDLAVCDSGGVRGVRKDQAKGRSIGLH